MCPSPTPSLLLPVLVGVCVTARSPVHLHPLLALCLPRLTSADAAVVPDLPDKPPVLCPFTPPHLATTDPVTCSMAPPSSLSSRWSLTVRGLCCLSSVSSVPAHFLPSSLLAFRLLTGLLVAWWHCMCPAVALGTPFLHSVSGPRVLPDASLGPAAASWDVF